MLPAFRKALELRKKSAGAATAATAATAAAGPIVARARTRGKKPVEKKPEFTGRKPVRISEVFEEYSSETPKQTIAKALAGGVPLDKVVMESLRSGYATLNEMPKLIGIPMLTDSDTRQWQQFAANLRDSHKQELAADWVRSRIGTIEVPRYNKFDVPDTNPDGTMVMYNITDECVPHLCRWLFGSGDKPIKFGSSVGEIEQPHPWMFDSRVSDIIDAAAELADGKTDEEVEAIERDAQVEISEIATEWRHHADTMKTEFGRLFRTREVQKGRSSTDRLNYAASLIAARIAGANAPDTDGDE
jgi:hypothetical protein